MSKPSISRRPSHPIKWMKPTTTKVTSNAKRDRTGKKHLTPIPPPVDCERVIHLSSNPVTPSPERDTSERDAEGFLILKRKDAEEE